MTPGLIRVWMLSMAFTPRYFTDAGGYCGLGAPYVAQQDQTLYGGADTVPGARGARCPQLSVDDGTLFIW